jgi:hypothetical protein
VRLLNEPPAFSRRIVKRLLDIGAVYSLDPEDVFDFWFPDADDFHAIVRAHSLGDKRAVCVAIKTSLRKSRYSPDEASRLLSDRRELPYCGAQAALERAIHASKTVPRCGLVKIALAKFEQAFYKAILSPLQTVRSGDPLRDFHGIVTAQLARIWFDRLDIVKAARLIAQGRPAMYPNDPDCETFNHSLRLTDSILRALRAAPST